MYTFTIYHVLISLYSTPCAICHLLLILKLYFDVSKALRKMKRKLKLANVLKYLSPPRHPSSSNAWRDSIPL